MINISQAKKIRRDICRTMGHEYKEVPDSSLWGKVRCDRCKKVIWDVFSAKRVTVPTFVVDNTPKVKYADLQVKKFNVLDRAKDRASDGDKT